MSGSPITSGRIEFGSEAWTAKAEQLLTEITKYRGDREFGESFDLAEASGVRIRVAAGMVKALVKVGLASQIYGGGFSHLGGWGTTPRLTAYVAAGFSLENALEHSLSGIASRWGHYDRNIAVARERLRTFDPARHKQVTYDRAVEKKLRSQGAAAALEIAFEGVTSCHPLAYEQHLEEVRAGKPLQWQPI